MEEPPQSRPSDRAVASLVQDAALRARGRRRGQTDRRTAWACLNLQDTQTDNVGMFEPPPQTFIRDDGPLSRGWRLTVFLLMKFLQFLTLLCRKRTSYYGTKLAKLGKSMFFQHICIRPLGAHARCGQGHRPSRDGARAAHSRPPTRHRDSTGQTCRASGVARGSVPRLFWDGNAAAGRRPCPHWPPGSLGKGLLGESSPPLPVYGRSSHGRSSREINRVTERKPRGVD